jgi:hypothetical protein
MIAFLRSNRYPAATTTQPELKDRLNDIRFVMVSNTSKIRANVKQGKPPLSDIADLETGAEAGIINLAALSEILLKELRFASRTISFITSVTTKFHEVAFDNTDRYINNGYNTDLNDLESQNDRVPEGDEEEDEEEEEEEPTFTSEQNHSSRLLTSSNEIRCKFITLCTSLGIRTLAISDLDECTASTDSTLFAAIHKSLSLLASTETISTPFETLCDISRAAWQMMNVLAFSNLYRYHYEFQKGPIARVDLSPIDSVFATR